MASSIELATGYVSIVSETSKLAKQLGGMFAGAERDASTTGKKMGAAMAKSFESAKPDIDALASEVERAEKRVAAQADVSARKQEAAKRRVEIAQAKVNEATAKYGEKSSQALSAVDRLAISEQKLEAETLAAADAQKRLQAELDESKSKLSGASKQSTEASKAYVKGWKGIGQRLKAEMSGGMKAATDAAHRQATDGGKRAGGSFAGAFKGSIAGLAAGFSIGAVVGGVKEVVSLAGEAEQSIGAIDTVFKDNAKTMHEWAATAAQTVGISGNEYRSLGTLLGSQLKNAGTPMDELADKTNALIGMGADMASMFGGTTKEAVEAISSALKGEMDPIEKYGITLSQAALEAEGLSKGILKPVVDSVKVSEAATKMTLAQKKYNEVVKKHGKDSDQAKRAQLALTSAERAYNKATAGKVPKLEGEAKALAVQSALYSQSADAQGNFMREEDTFEHKRQVALATWDNLKEKIGGAFLPAMTSAFGFINDTALPAMESFSGWVGGVASAIGERLGPALQNTATWVSDNSTALTIAAGVIGALMIPMLIRWGVQATVAAAKNVAAFILTRLEAIKTAAVFVAQSYKIIGQWIAMSAAAVASGIKTAAVWTGTIIKNAVMGAISMTVQAAKVVASWVAMSAAAVASGIKTAAVWTGTIIKQAAIGAAQFAVSAGRVVASWAMMAARALVQGAKMAVSWTIGVVVPAAQAAVTMGIQAAKIVAKWVFMGAQSLLQAGRMAAAWFIALGPIGWAIAAIVGIAAIVIANWDNIKKWTVDTWNSVSATIKDVWLTKIKPIFAVFGSFFKATWENVLKPAFNAVKAAWKSISDSIKYVWNTFIRPVFDTFGKILKGDFVGAFQTARDAVEKIWNDIKGVVKEPITFVVNKVINEGLIGAFNKVTGFIDPEHKVIPKIGNVGLPAGFATGGWTGPGHKYKEAGVVHADEFVIRKESQRSIERSAPGFMDSLNRFGAKALGYANGGLVRPVKGGQITSGFGAARGPYGHAGIDFAVSVGTPVHAAMDGTVLGYQPTGRTGRYVFLSHPGNRNTYYGHLSQPQVSPGQQVKAGQQIGLSGNTGRSTGPHLHWETWTGGKPVDPAAYLNGAMLPEGGVSGGGGSSPFQALIDFKESIVGRFKDAFSGGGMFADLAQGAGTKLTSDILGWFPAQLGKLGDKAQDVWGNTKDWFNGKDSDVQAAVRGVAAGYGWDSGRHWSALSKLIAKESSWDPNVTNKSGSSAFGLFQFLDGTWSSVGASKTSDPAGQAQAGMKYIQQRYGDPEKAWAFHKKHNWYANGGLVTPTLYDGGGWLRNTGGPQLIDHKKSKPDAVLTNAQWGSVMKSIEISQKVADVGQATTVYNIQTPQGATVDDLTAALRFEKRRQERGGVRSAVSV